MGLDIAAAGGHHGLLIESAAAPQHLARLLIAHRRDGTGVDDVGVGHTGKIHQLMSPAQQFLLHGLCFILIHLASQGVNTNAHLALFLSFEYNKMLLIIQNHSLCDKTRQGRILRGTL